MSRNTPLAPEPHSLPRLTSRWTQVGAWRIYAQVADQFATAQAPPVVLVHGLGVASRYMVPTARCLAPCYPVSIPELPGFGKSTHPRHVLSLPELADALAGWMAANHLGPAVLIGNSMGCQVLVELALRHPQLVDRLVLQGPTIDQQAHTRTQQFARLLHDSIHEPIAQWLIVARDYLVCGPRRFLKTLTYALEHRVEEKLPHILVPTLVVRGALDPIVPQRWAEQVAALLPHGQLQVLPGAPHTLNYSHPQAFVALLRPFIERGIRNSEFEMRM